MRGYAACDLKFGSDLTERPRLDRIAWVGSGPLTQAIEARPLTG